ncbi:MAG: hypothetical protein ABII85_01375 [Bacillota bacterium]
MYDISFLFNLNDTRRFDIKENTLEFIHDDKICKLTSRDNNLISDSTELKIICSSFDTEDHANNYVSKIKSWLVKFAYKTKTIIYFPKENYYIEEQGGHHSLQMSVDFKYYVSLDDDKKLFLDSICEYSIMQQLVYSMYNNITSATTDEAQIIFIFSLLEHMSSNILEGTKYEKDSVLKLIDSIITTVKNCSIDLKTKKTVIDKLEKDKNQSIRKKLLFMLDEMKIAENILGLSYKKFIDACYDIRSKIVHEGIAHLPKNLKQYSLQAIALELIKLTEKAIKKFVDDSN